MLKHVVFMKFKPTVTEDQIADIAKSLGALPPVISEIKAYQFGRDILHTPRSYDFALVSEFESLDTLKRYQAHPDHMVVVNKLLELCESILAVDFEL